MPLFFLAFFQEKCQERVYRHKKEGIFWKGKRTIWKQGFYFIFLKSGWGIKGFRNNIYPLIIVQIYTPGAGEGGEEEEVGRQGEGNKRGRASNKAGTRCSTFRRKCRNFLFLLENSDWYLKCPDKSITGYDMYDF